MKRALAAAAILATALSPAQGLAACVQADLSGDWFTTVTTVDGGNMSWHRCNMDISSSGAIAASSCPNSLGQVVIQRSGFLHRREDSCVFSGRFVINNVIYRVVHTALARTKVTADGSGTTPFGAFTFTMTKR